MKKIDEEAVPANNMGGGAIEGAGVGPNGEPGVYQKKKKKKLSDPQLAFVKRWMKAVK